MVKFLLGFSFVEFTVVMNISMRLNYHRKDGKNAVLHCKKKSHYVCKNDNFIQTSPK